MNSIWEIAPYLTGLAGVGLALFLFLEMRRSQLEFQERWNKRQQTVQAELGKLRGSIHDLKSRLEDSERAAATLVPPPPIASGLNLNRRAQAVRMFRRGEKPRQVAASLGMSVPEVELLEKVQKIISTTLPEPEVAMKA